MSPSALLTEREDHDNVVASALKNGVNPNRHSTLTKGPSFTNGSLKAEYLLDRNLHKAFPVVKGGKGNYLFLSDGRKIFDSTTGAAVSCLGHGNQRVIDAIAAQMQTGTLYLASTFWMSEVVEELCKELINGTDGKMARVYLTGSGQLPTPTQISFKLIPFRFRGYGGCGQDGPPILLREQ